MVFCPLNNDYSSKYTEHQGEVIGTSGSFPFIGQTKAEYQQENQSWN